MPRAALTGDREQPLFSREARVKIYYFIGRLFPKAEVSSAGIYGGFHGGKAQALLDQLIREELGLLRLGGGLSIDNQLREFVVESATDNQIFSVLELVPIAAKALSLPRGVSVSNSVEELLSSLGVAATFNERGELDHSSKDNSPSLDPADALLGPEQRVRIYHLLIDNFDTEQDGGLLDGATGGEEQEMLEHRLVRRLGRLEISTKPELIDRLREFVLTAPAAEVLILLELMPQVRLDGYSAFVTTGIDERRELVRLRERISALLRGMGIGAAFTEDGRLERTDADTVVQSIGGLPTREELERNLPAVLMAYGLVSLVFIDLDQFKLVNDRLGHDAGNKCLADFVEIVSAIAKLRGKVYRYGGDEFVIVMPNFSLEEAAATAERVRRAVEQARIGGGVLVTTSIGVASSIEFLDAPSLIAAADNAMYAAKMVDGPNQVREAPLSEAIATRAIEQRAKAEGR